MMTLKRSIAACLPWIVSLAACGGSGDGAGSGWAGTTRDSAGIAIVENSVDGVWTGDDRWRVHEIRRIGATEGDSDYQFAQISGVAELSDGRIVVSDAQAQRLQIFSPEGSHLRTIGGPGSGPGEFGVGAGPVLVGPGDSIYVPDISNQRLNRFTPEAEPAGSTAIDLASGFPVAWQDTPEGRLITQVRPFDLGGDAVGDDLILSLGTDGSPRDTLHSFPSGQTFQFSGGLPDLTLFSPEPIWSMTSSGGLVYGVNDDYEFRVYEGGELVRIVRRPFERRPVADEDETLMKEAMIRFLRDLGLPDQALDIMAERMDFAEHYPSYAFIRGGPEGSIWVQRFQRPSDLSEEERRNFDPTLGFGSPIWDVFGADGRYLGELAMPERYQPLRVEGDRIYGVWRDELDVQHILVLELDRPRAGPAPATN
ncbi:MAG: 6-bladed beta-propeller [Gemmatimonadota bacterium]|nr:6-bladed beta-propeller [Gemmatimonadota bacterium]